MLSLFVPALLTIAEPARLPVVAVFAITDESATLKSRELAQLSAYLTAQIAEGGAFTVIPNDQIQAALSAKKADSYKTCVDQACQVEIGRELAAQKVLRAQIIQVGSQCAVSATLFDLRSAASERAATHKAGCDQDGLVASLERVATAIKLGAPASPAPAASPAASAAPPRPEPPVAADAVDVRFEPRDAGETWTVRDAGGASLCTAPC